MILSCGHKRLAMLAAPAIVAVSLSSVSVAVARSTSNSQRATRQFIAAHALTSMAHRTVIVWALPRSGLALSDRDPSAVAVIRGNSLTYWSDGQRQELIRFHARGLWNTVRIRFGVTSAMVNHALTTASTVHIASPFVRSLSASPSTVPPVLTVVDDYGTSVSQLAKVAPFAVRYAGASILAKQFARVTIATVSNPYANGPYKAPSNSGQIVTFIYSSNPARLGVDDHELTLTFASDSSRAGQANATFIGGSRAIVRANGLTAYEANANQIVFRIGHVIGVITSTLQPSVAQWKTVLSALQTP
jgi:hypothetical protein